VNVAYTERRSKQSSNLETRVSRLRILLDASVRYPRSRPPPESGGRQQAQAKTVGGQGTPQGIFPCNHTEMQPPCEGASLTLKTPSQHGLLWAPDQWLRDLGLHAARNNPTEMVACSNASLFGHLALRIRLDRQLEPQPHFSRDFSRSVGRAVPWLVLATRTCFLLAARAPLVGTADMPPEMTESISRTPSPLLPRMRLTRPQVPRLA